MKYKKGDLLKVEICGEDKLLFFCGYSRMKDGDGEPLLLLGTDPTNKNTFGNYTRTCVKENLSYTHEY